MYNRVTSLLHIKSRKWSKEQHVVINRERGVALINHEEIPESNQVNIVFNFSTFVFQMLSWSEDKSKALVRFFGAAHQRYIRFFNVIK